MNKSRIIDIRCLIKIVDQVHDTVARKVSDLTYRRTCEAARVATITVYQELGVALSQLVEEYV